MSDVSTNTSLAGALVREPDAVRVYADDLPPMQMMPAGNARWHSAMCELRVRPTGPVVHVTLESSLVAFGKVELTWRRDTDAATALVAGEGTNGWRRLHQAAPLATAFLLNERGKTHAAGVRCGDSSVFSHWTMTPESITLTLDARCGGRGVLAPDRPVELASFVARDGAASESAATSLRHLCGMLAPSGALCPREPIVGLQSKLVGPPTWDGVLRDAERAVDLCRDGDATVRPWVLLDPGWQTLPAGWMSLAAGWNESLAMVGPWDRGAEGKFVDLALLAKKIREIGARPGIRFRPLLTRREVPDTWYQPAGRIDPETGLRPLDPSVPEVLELIAADIRRFREWGFEIVQHEFTVFDTVGVEPLKPLSLDWTFADESQTTASILRQLYRTIRSAADDLTVVAAGAARPVVTGYADLCRVGSNIPMPAGEELVRRTVSALAMRGRPQHKRWYAAHAGDVVIDTAQPGSWRVTRDLLDLLAHAGAPLLVRVVGDPQFLTPDHVAAMREAFAIAQHLSRDEHEAEPIDWLTSDSPRVWRVGDATRSFAW
jgi:alpha-galactosidase